MRARSKIETEGMIHVMGGGQGWLGLQKHVFKAVLQSEFSVSIMYTSQDTIIKP